MENLRREYTPNPTRLKSCSSLPRRSLLLYGTIQGDLHLHLPCAPAAPCFCLAPIVWAVICYRALFTARISLTVGLFGIMISFAIGIVVGGLAGYYGGLIDNLVQRVD